MPAMLTRKNEFQVILYYLVVQNLPGRDYVYMSLHGSILNDEKNKYIIISISMIFK